MVRKTAIKNNNDVKAWTAEVKEELIKELNKKNIINQDLGNIVDGIDLIRITINGYSDIVLGISPLITYEYGTVEFSNVTLQLTAIFAPRYSNIFDTYGISKNKYWGGNKGVNKTSSYIINHIFKSAFDNNLDTIISPRNLLEREFKYNIGVLSSKSYANKFSWNKPLKMIDNIVSISNDFETATNLDSMFDFNKTMFECTLINVFDNLEYGTRDIKITNNNRIGENDEGLINKNLYINMNMYDNSFSTYKLYSNKGTYNSIEDVYTIPKFDISFMLKKLDENYIYNTNGEISFNFNSIMNNINKLKEEFNTKYADKGLSIEENSTSTFINTYNNIVNYCMNNVFINEYTFVSPRDINYTQRVEDGKTYIRFDFIDDITGLPRTIEHEYHSYEMRFNFYIDLVIKNTNKNISLDEMENVITEINNLFINIKKFFNFK